MKQPDLNCQEGASPVNTQSNPPASREAGGALEALYNAILAAQMEMPIPGKDMENTHLHTRYASLIAVRNATVPYFHKHGIAVLQEPVTRDGKVSVRTTLRMGLASHSFDGPEITPAKGGPQELGSLITYLRRYNLLAISAVAGDEHDDDGQGAEPEPMDRRQMSAWIDEAAKQAELNDAQLAQCLSELTGHLITMWRREKDDVLARTVNNWGSVLKVAKKLNLIKE